MPIPNLIADPIAFVVAMALDGVILTGGNDLLQYGGNAPARDALERVLLGWSLQKGFPVLGVCRGLQMIQNLMGGKLESVEGHVGIPSRIVWNGSWRAVNSYHKWGIRAVPPELLVIATAEDGTVEAVQHKTRPITGIMWHPERSQPFDDDDIELVRRIWKIS